MSYPINVAELCFGLVPESQDLQNASFGEHGGIGYITFWNTATLGPQPTPEQLAAVTQEQIDSARLAKLRAAAKRFQDDQQAQNIALRVTVRLLVDELNILRQWVTDLKAATAAATTLANFKTGVAALPNTPQRTYVQARNAIETLIDSEAE